MDETKAGCKIIILGCAGSGKSTLAKKLQMRTGLPLVHLDNVWWKPDGTHIGREEFDNKLQSLLQGDEWIIDGDYSRTYERRFLACDTVVFLDYSEEDCMRGICERVGKARDDIPWVGHSLDPELADQVRRYRNENRPKVYALMEKYPDKRVFVFRSKDEAQDWLSGL